jgi:hypothetical protein
MDGKELKLGKKKKKIGMMWILMEINSVIWQDFENAKKKKKRLYNIIYH